MMEGLQQSRNPHVSSYCKRTTEGRDKKETTISCLSVKLCSSVIHCTFYRISFILVNFYHNSNRSAVREAAEIHHQKQSHFHGCVKEKQRGACMAAGGRKHVWGCWCSRKTASRSQDQIATCVSPFPKDGGSWRNKCYVKFV